MAETDVQVLEEGNIYFVCRPKTEQCEIHSVADVQRLYVVLEPGGARRYRLLVIGKKKMPDQEGRDRFWGFVDALAQDGDDIAAEFKGFHAKDGDKVVSRSVAEGKYKIFKHGDHTHLSYTLDLPKELGDDCKELNIGQEGSYLINLKINEANIETEGLPKDAEERSANVTEELPGVKFIPLDPPSMIDYEGAEFILVGSTDGAKSDQGEASDNFSVSPLVDQAGPGIVL